MKSVSQKKFKVGDIVKFHEKCHNSEISNAIVKITGILGSTYRYDILKAPNTDRKKWSTYDINFTDEVEYYPVTKLEKALYEI